MKNSNNKKKIILSVVVIIILAIAAFAAVSVNQLKSFEKAIDDPLRTQDISDLMNGNCSKLDIVKAKTSDIENKFSAICSNFALKIIIEKQSGKSICEDTKKAEEKFRMDLQKIEDKCTNTTTLVVN